MRIYALCSALIGVLFLSVGEGYIARAAQTGAPAAVAEQDVDERRVSELLQRLEEAIRQGDASEYLDLLSASASRRRADTFTSLEIRPGVTRVVVVERDRQHLRGTLPGNGYRLMVDAFVEYGDRARIVSWQLDLVRIGDDEWAIADQERLSAVDNLYRLSINASRQFEARDFKLTSQDLELTLAEGAVFTIDTDQGVTGLVLMGRGEMRFSPTPETEKGQIVLFSGAETLESRFDTAYVRVGNLELHADPSALVERPVQARDLRRAEEVFREESPKTYGVGLGDLTSDSWSLLPGGGDFLAEVRTRRFDTLTYARSGSEAEDISLFDRRRQRNLSVYASEEKLAARGPFYDEDDLAAYDVLDYEIDLSMAPTPERQWMDGRATLRLRIRSEMATQLTLRLAEPLVVHSVVSREYGRLFHLRVKNQNSLLVSLPKPLARDTELGLVVSYSGRLAPQAPDRETVALQQREPDLPGGPEWREFGISRGEATYLYSSRSYWYPQAPITDYATAVVRITVPAAFSCIATGEPAADSPTVFGEAGGAPARNVYVFNANRPVRYLAVAISRFTRAARKAVTFDDSEAVSDDEGTTDGSTWSGAGYDGLDLIVETHPRQVSRGRDVVDSAADVARFYRSIVGDSPYPSFTLALVENALPGGHSPAYFALLNEPLPNTPVAWRTDPANFEGFPEFFLAHELAHQWWGQAIGWRNYHEQWLSEGFAQYFAALYAQQHRGDDVFASVLRQLRKWAIGQSDQGPVYLGYRLGHIRRNSRVFRALVYNKGAAVLHMLRRLIGDEAFFRGVRRFYEGSRYRKTGTDELRAAMEAESGRSLERFFERWIYGSTLPRITFSYQMESSAGGPGEIVLRFDQDGDIFDVPVTVVIQYADRRSVELRVPVTERSVEVRVPADGVLRAVDVSNDDGALAEIRKR